MNLDLPFESSFRSLEIKLETSRVPARFFILQNLSWSPAFPTDSKIRQSDGRSESYCPKHGPKATKITPKKTKKPQTSSNITPFSQNSFKKTRKKNSQTKKNMCSFSSTLPKKNNQTKTPEKKKRKRLNFSTSPPQPLSLAFPTTSCNSKASPKFRSPEAPQPIAACGRVFPFWSAPGLGLVGGFEEFKKA